MDEQTRRAVDEACLRLLGWTQEDIARLSCFAVPSVSQRPDLVVPLAEALRARQFVVRIIARCDGWWVTLEQEGCGDIRTHADTLPEALAAAAIRAVGMEP